MAALLSHSLTKSVFCRRRLHPQRPIPRRGTYPLASGHLYLTAMDGGNACFAGAKQAQLFAFWSVPLILSIFPGHAPMRHPCRCALAGHPCPAGRKIIIHSGAPRGEGVAALTPLFNIALSLNAGQRHNIQSGCESDKQAMRLG